MDLEIGRMDGRRSRQAAAERQEAALQLRRAGLDYQGIAERLGYAGKQGAHSAVQRALRNHIAEGVDHLRALEAARLDALLAAVWPAATEGDVAAVRAALAISERRARLFGLDAPARAQLSVERVDVRSMSDDELQRLVDGSWEEQK